MQLHTGVLRRKQPIDSQLSSIAFVLKRLHIEVQCLFVRHIVGPGLPGKDTELNLSHVQPTPMFGRVMKLQPMSQSIGFSRLKRFIQSGDSMGVQVIQHQADHGSVRLRLIHQPLHTVSEVLFGAARSDLDMPIARL
jgi:hypothetical protein